MQIHTQLPGKKAGGLRAVMTIALLSASLPLVTACNPFAKTTTTAAVPACQSNNTATIRYTNSGTVAGGATQYRYIDYQLKAIVAAGATSPDITVSAGTSHYIQSLTSTGAIICNPYYITYAQCYSGTVTC